MRLNQVTLPVTDLEPSVAFYSTLGLKLIVLSEGRYARFEMPEGGSTLSLHRVEEGPAVGDDSAMIYFEVEDLDSIFAELESAGVRFDSPPTDQRWLWREARLRDPDGNRLCLFHAGENRRFPPWRLAGS